MKNPGIKIIFLRVIFSFRSDGVLIVILIILYIFIRYIVDPNIR